MSSLSSDCESSYYTESEAESDYVTHEEGQPANYNHTLEVEDIIRKHVDITTKNAVGLNHQYKAKLLLLRQTLEGLLLRCQNRLLEVDKSLDDIRLNLTPRTRPSRPRHPGYICGQPFFKDHELYPGPHNEDYLCRKNVKKEFFPLDLFESIETFWTRKDKQMLRESIASQAYEFVRRENQLRDKMSISSENARRIIKERIELKALPLAEIWHKAQAYDGKYGSQKFTVDWLKISTAIMGGRHSAVTCEGMWNNFLIPGLKRSMWTPDEESSLVAAVEANKRCHWNRISLCVENRSEYQCLVHYQTNFSELSQIKRNPWTPEEDDLLMRLVNENRIGNNIIWNKIVERIPFRNKVQVYHRYKYTLLRPLRGAKFTAEEDCVITAYVQQYGDDFRFFPDDLLPGRTSKQIRARYMNTLRFVNTHVGWSLEEDKRLMTYIAEHLTEEGAQKISWADCSKYLGNHSRLSCRTRYYTIEKFLERHPNATLENVPRREKKKLSSSVTDKNWIKTIVEIKSTPKTAQKPGEAFELSRSSAIECGLNEQMKFSFRYKFGYKLAVDARHNHVFAGTKILFYLLEGFQEPSSENVPMAGGLLHVKDEALLKTILHCPLDWPKLVSIMRPKMTLAGDAMLFCRIPPSFNTVLGLRGICLNACSEPSKQTLVEQKTKKIRSFDAASYDQAIAKMESNECASCKVDVMESRIATPSEDIVMVDTNYQSTEYLTASGCIAEDNETLNRTEDLSPDNKAFIEAERHTASETIRKDNETAQMTESNSCNLELLTDEDEPLTAVDIIRMLRSRRNAHQYGDDSDSEQEFSHLPND
uniref:snRNA-activating protein complex subunit 4 n=1 Tax=Anopheles maculatus TaxID=74869 RepID=A0A182SKB4_9DIPT